MPWCGAATTCSGTCPSTEGLKCHRVGARWRLAPRPGDGAGRFWRVGCTGQGSAGCYAPGRADRAGDGGRDSDQSVRELSQTWFRLRGSTQSGARSPTPRRRSFLRSRPAAGRRPRGEAGDFWRTSIPPLQHVHERLLLERGAAVLLRGDSGDDSCPLYAAAGSAVARRLLNGQYPDISASAGLVFYLGDDLHKRGPRRPDDTGGSDAAPTAPTQVRPMHCVHPRGRNDRCAGFLD